MALTHIFLVSGIVALILSVATSALLFILAASLCGPNQASPALPLLSAIVQTLSCVTWGFLIWRQFCLDTRFHVRGQGGLEKRAFLLFASVGIVPVVFAAVITGTALGWSQGNLAKRHVLVSGLPAPNFIAIVFVVWGITLALQALHLITTGCLLQKPRARPSQQRFSIGEGLSANEAGAPQQMTEASRPETAETARTQRSNPFRETPSSSSPPSLIPSEGPSSIRSSFSTLPRPSSSKRGLIIRQPSLGLKHSRPSSSEVRQSSSEGTSRRPSQDGGFDSWDTSQVSFQIREALQATGKQPPLKESRLAPIPGSRSPSPAKALEGPFFDHTPSDDSPPLRPLPQPSVSRPNSPPSSSPVVANFTSVFPASTPPSSPPPTAPKPAGLGLKLMTAIPSHPPSNQSSLANSPILRNSSRPLSRKPSGEEHIHPLFRTTSPSPAPSPSLGTVVTAAPEAGQLMDERVMRSRMRKGSLPSASSPLVRSESSPNMREKAKSEFQPLSAIGAGGESPPPLPRKASSRLHQRKRSASLETFVKTSNNV